MDEKHNLKSNEKRGKTEKEIVLARIRVTLSFTKETFAWFEKIKNKKITSIELASLPVDEKLLQKTVKPKEIHYERKGYLVFKGVMCEQEKEALKGLSKEESYKQTIENLYRDSQIRFVEKEGNLIFSNFKSGWEKFSKERVEEATQKYFDKLSIEKRPHIKVTIYQYGGSWVLGIIITVIGIFLGAVVQEISKDFYKYIKKIIKTKLEKRASEDSYMLLKDEAVKLQLPSPPTEEKIIVCTVSTPEAEISELIQLMFVGLMGAFQESEEIVRNFHDKHDRRRHGFLLFEVLTHQPLYKDQRTNLDEALVVGPFPHRLARKTISWKDKNIAENIIMHIKDAMFINPIYNRWNKGKDNKPPPIDHFAIKFEPLRMPYYIDPRLIFFAKGLEKDLR